MDRKAFWSNTKTGFILKNILIAIFIVIIGVVILFIGLRNYTQHGVEVTIPDITGMYIEEAQMILQANNLTLQIIDSTYSSKTPLGTIVEQTPIAGSHAKKGRIIYAVQNARFRRPIIVPEVRDMSLRQAEATLQALGLHVDNIDYEPSTYKDIVLDVRRDEQPLLPGDRIPEGTAITLVVGRGQGNTEVTIPALTGKSLNEARSLLLSSLLTIGVIEYDIEPTEENKDLYVVYSQSPTSGTIVVEGTNVNVKMSMDIEKTITADNEGDEEDFF